MAGFYAFSILAFGLLAVIDAGPYFDNTIGESLIAKLGNLREDVDPTATIETMQCYDDTDTDRDNLEMTIETGEDFISIQPTENSFGDIKPNLKILDYENKNNRNNLAFTIRCRNRISGGFVLFSGKIVITDANDNPPIFVRTGGLNDTYQTQLDEVLPASVTLPYLIYDKITVTDADGVDNNIVKAECVEVEVLGKKEECAGLFSVVAKATDNGVYKVEIYAERKFYSTGSDYTVILKAVNKPNNKDTDKELESDTQNFVVNIRDLQNKEPLFATDGLSFKMYENRQTGELVENKYITAYDQDIGDPNQIRFELEIDPIEPFAFNQSFFKLGAVVPPNKDLGERDYKVQLLVNNLIDREAIANQAKTLFVYIKAIEYDTTGRLNRNPQTAVEELNIQILDINDEKPTFSSNNYNINFQERQGSVFTSGVYRQISNNIDIQVQDHDSSAFNSFNVSIISGNAQSYFKLDKNSGSLQEGFVLSALDEILDYERGNNRYELVLLAVDVDKTTLSSSATVVISLVDENDNLPQFKFQAGKSEYWYSISEDVANGTTVGVVSADDKDSGAYGTIVEYRIEDLSNLFVIDDTGVIRLNGRVDYESRNAYSFKVYAYDGGQSNQRQEGSAIVNINITNVADVVPRFATNYEATLYENSKDLIPTIKIKATSQEGSGIIQYTVVKVVPATVPIGRFRVDVNTGVVNVTSSIDYFQTDNGIVYVTFQATAGMLYSNTTAVIKVVNLNNFPPVFQPPNQNQFQKLISESAQIGDIVFQFSVIDMDLINGDNGGNGEVKFSIVRGANEDFIIGVDSGEIKVSGTATLDVDEQKQYSIVVVAKDLGEPAKSSTATLIVNILDANNKAPRFDNTIYFFAMQEKAPIGTSVGTVNATDPDVDHLIQYSIDNARFEKNAGAVPQYINISRIISIDSNGLITVAGDIDRSSYDSISLDVIAKDLKTAANAPDSATVPVVITIRAADDPDIYFISNTWSKENPVIKVSYTEERTSNDSVLTLRATDPLTTESIRIFEEIPGTDVNNIFYISGNDIYVTNVLDYETLPGFAPKVLTLVVKALSSDMQRSGTATISVTVLDLNDNSPVFEQKIYSFTVDEDKKYAHEIGEIKATDADSGSSGEVEYTLTGSEDFAIYTKRIGTENVAVLLVANNRTLNYHEQPEYNIQLTAMDNINGLGVRLWTTINIKIRVIDRNNNAPIFRQNPYRFDVIGTKLVEDENAFGVVVADDADTGLDGQVEYSIVSSSRNDSGFNYFRILTLPAGTTGFAQVFYKGNLMVRSSLLDLPDRTTFNLTVSATDKGIDKQLSSYTTVIITVNKGVIDPKPQWDDGLLSRVKINENSPNGTFVYTVHANPADLASSIIYSFVSAGNVAGDFSKFTIGSSSGTIRVAGDIDYEKQKIFSLLILATDTANATLFNQYLLIVEVLDVEDNDPSFKSCKDVYYNIPVEKYVNEEQPIDTFVYRAVACDNDQPPNNKITYSWYTDVDGQYCNTDVQLKFRLNKDTGEIFTKIVLDRETVSQYLLCVEASQRLSVRRKRDLASDLASRRNHDSVLYVKVIVRDLNDNGPKFTINVEENVILAYPLVVIGRAEATDLDIAPNNGIRYSIEQVNITIAGKTQRALSAFNINSNDGTISVGITDYTDYVGGYFTVIIKAEDANSAHNMIDRQTRTIFVTNRANQIRVVFNRPADNSVYKDATDMINELNGLERGKVYYEIKTVSYHIISNDQDPSFDKTDVCMVVVYDETVMSANAAVKRLDGVEAVKDVLQKYGAVDAGPCEPARSLYPVGWETYWWVLVAFAIFIFICTCILIVMVVVLYRQYRNYMDTRRTYLVPGN